jgi:CRP-like cAMP-binding protein
VIERCGRRGDDRASVCLDAAAEELAMARAAAARLTVRCAHQRLAALLLHLQARQRACGPLWLPMSRTDIAAHLALTLETVSRSFAYLKARRLIATPDLHTVDLLDRPRLALLAAPAVADAGAPLGHA